MKTPLAWKNLVNNKVRTTVGVAGVGFAVILIFMQMGFKNAIRKTATQIYDALEFDLMLRSPAYLHLTDARSFPRTRVFQAASLPEVERARPFYVGLSDWQAPPQQRTAAAHRGDDSVSGQWRGIVAMGTDPNDPPFSDPKMRQSARRLTDPRFVLFDRKSKPEYGISYDKIDRGKDIETKLGSMRVRIIGLFELGTGMAANGACMTNPEGYIRACPWQKIDEINFGLITLRDRSQRQVVKAKLDRLLGPDSTDENSLSSSNRDVEVLTRDQVNAMEETRWVDETPFGQIFNLGVWVGLFVGVAIVYQVLSSDIANMMSEYATLRAMGYSNFYLTKVVLQQSILLALIGFAPSVLISWLLYQLIGTKSGMPLHMTSPVVLQVLGLAIAMCTVSGIAALRKLFQADPVDLF